MFKPAHYLQTGSFGLLASLLVPNHGVMMRHLSIQACGRVATARCARLLTLAMVLSALGAADSGVATVQIISLRVEQASVAKASGSTTARIVITDVTGQPQSLAYDLEMSLTHDAPSWIALPTSVRLPAGSSSVDFPIDLVGDGSVDGTIPVVITGTFQDENGEGQASARLSLIDDLECGG